LNVESLTPFQLRMCIVAAQVAGAIEASSLAFHHKKNGTVEIRLSRDGRGFDHSYKREMGSTVFTAEPEYN